MSLLLLSDVRPVTCSVLQRAAPPAARRCLPPAASGLLLGFALLAAGCNKPAPAAPPAAPPQVGVVTLQPERQAIVSELPGRTSASQVAEIRPQVGGIVLRRLFEEGSLVRAGQVLYELDAASFQANLNSAQAQVEKAEATLAAARVTAARNSDLAKIDAVSQQLADDSQAAVKQAQADAAVAMATLAASRIELDRTRITAPISGRIDISSVTPGALVTANQATALTSVQRLDPMLVDVVQSSSELLTLRRDLASGRFQRVGADEAPIRLLLEDGSAYPQIGRLKVSGVTVDRGTGAVTLRAQVPNPDGVLMPGMFVRARLEAAVAEQALLVPQQGVSRTPAGEPQALVVGAGGKVERRALKLDRAVGNRWLVSDGLRAGDQVIVEGVQRARPGSVVQAVAANLGSGKGAPAAPASAAMPVASR